MAYTSIYIVSILGPCQHVGDISDKYLNSISRNTHSVSIYAWPVFVYTFFYSSIGCLHWSCMRQLACNIAVFHCL